MIDTQHIRIDEFNYPLPDERIAKFPLAQRDHSKLLVYNQGRVGEDVFYNLPDYIDKGSLMVFNNTKVIQARLHFYKETGACIEVFLLEPAFPADYEQAFQALGHCAWHCLVGNQKKWKSGSLTMHYTLDGQDHTLQVDPFMDGSFLFQWSSSHSFSEIIDAVGELPIPPYLNRKTEESDKRTYQTVYSKIQGSVAAPTAGLHFTENVLKALDEKGVIRDEVTLHVGAGTFKPVKSEEIADHEMHSETFCVKRETLVRLLEHDCHAVAVGTTSVRTLESLYYLGLKVLANPDIQPHEMHVSQWEPYKEGANIKSPSIGGLRGFSIQALLDYLDRNKLSALHASTQIIIAPGYEYKIVNRLVTNFHQPKSTLLLLVSAFVKGDWKSIYRYALSHDFRFLSYGDSSILIP